jgi:RHS repeat-associated protein
VYPATGRKTINKRLNHIVDHTTGNGGGAGVVTQNPGNYNYDAAGNRVVKDYHATQNTTLTSRTWTIRDAQGTVLAIYTRKPTVDNSHAVTRTEAPIYGSSRIGQSTRTATYDVTASGEATLLGTVYSRELGKCACEFVDHLGNVRATISDILVPRTATTTYDADVLTLTDYYLFGMQMDTRTWEAGGVAGHRYGYNGKENDDEVKGQGNQQDYGFRIYDPRVARFLSVDPLAPDYPWYTPYQFAGNRPLDRIDLDGLERVNVSLFEAGKTGLPHLKKSEWYVVGGTVAWGSFAVAARHNTPSNPGVYQNVEDRHNYYRWAHTEASRRGSNWFGAAAMVTQWNAVGAADNINLWWLNDAAERFLQEGNRYLFSHNMRNLDGLLNGTLDRTFVDANGSKVSLGGLTGKQLDYALVQFEQTKVQEFIDSYRSSNPGIDMAKIMESINFSMTS